jgi:CubicO group peptidase (beta-lactamase class C family)
MTQVGIQAGHMIKTIDAFMKAAVTDGVFPGGVLLVSRKGKILFHEAYGKADIFSGSQVTVNTVFDLASLTKPLATTLAVMKLEEQHQLTLEQTLGEIMDCFRGRETAAITVRHLLNHTSGLPAYKPYFEQIRLIPEQNRKKKFRELLVREDLVNPVGSKTLYSDIGFMMLCWIVETVSGKRLDHFVRDEIYEPSGLRELFFVDLMEQTVQETSVRFAATEKCPWREKVITGEVHDDNAFIVGGIDGHAGLFGTAREVGRLLLMLQGVFHGHPEQGIPGSKTIRKYFTKHEGDSRVLGFDTPDPVNPSCGRHFSPKTIGHLGFTGTSFWMDLGKEVNVILLTNRIHPTRENVRIRAFRPVIHDMVMKNI